MARRFNGVMLAAAAFAAGCQATTQTAQLPQPTFAKPVIKRPAYVAPVVVAVAPVRPNVARVVTPPPAPARLRTDVPASWVPAANAQPREWDWIVIHHSATPTGGVVAFDKAHKAKGWDGVGYDFVIGNGTDTADGQVEVGYRWPIQAQGAHAYTPDELYNKHGIGICLVGNMDDHPPTAKQMRALDRLVAYLADTYRIKQSNIIGHKMTGKQTDCPGNLTNIAQIRADVARLRQTAIAEDPKPLPGTELMQTAMK